MRKKGDVLAGAFLVYDNQLDTLVRKDWGSDRNEGRERLGMGVLLARWLRRQPRRDSSYMASLEAYYDFVCKRLQRADGAVLNGIAEMSEINSYKRLYNWPWAMQLHLEMSRLLGSDRCLRRFIRTVENFYSNGGERFYPIGLPVLDGLRMLKLSRRQSDYDRLLALFTKHGARIEATGLKYPPHEVNFEQSIVAPAAIVLLELHRATGESHWLTAAKPHLALLELFGGRQPSHRLNDIAIRHWDGYWFGKRRRWGDVFPHYWSTLTAVAFHHYAQITSDADYSRRAQDIIANNLSAFSPDGRASCAFVYPVSVNGEAAHSPDEYANDQDWALVHALQVREQ